MVSPAVLTTRENLGGKRKTTPSALQTNKRLASLETKNKQSFTNASMCHWFMRGRARRFTIANVFYIISVRLKGYSGFKNPFSRLSFDGFKIIFDHMRVHILNIGSLAHS